MTERTRAGDETVSLEEVRRRALELSGDEQNVEAWLDKPIHEYGNRTPRELVAQGRGDVLVKHIGQLVSGSSG
jgi:uncharacterized protein (DUF2384 family)